MNKTSNPWGSAEVVAKEQSWLEHSQEIVEQNHFDWLNPFDETIIPLERYVELGVAWVVEHCREFFQMIRMPIDTVLSSIENFFQSIPASIFLICFTLLAWQLAGRKIALGSFISLAIIGLIGAWSETMVTLSLVFTSLFFCLIMGIPLGIWMSRNEGFALVMRPILDAMQTTPAFVYLVPVVMLFGIGNVPGVVVTIIFALPPLIRLTNLGIRQVPKDLIEVSQSFGATPWQMLLKVQLPVAMPTIMAGINQALMLSISMVVIASMIAVGGLGQMVLRGIGRLDMGLAVVGGVGIVLLAVVLDRITQSLGEKNVHSHLHWFEKGPIGLVYSILKQRRNYEPKV
ncbi:glycine betaine/L-proline ABC transporter permease ProW [Sulfurospirillum barnesii]|uniref:ABC-type proline/glycine betaine transport system, permease component n=1 Tax=Sulfurospirillum barnesii (strain ATCC 700032 / DSM 10660 / SES-3) TaxID=760154 RepID=I3XTS2_SULBS|nr:glycine betaine/L-proline ABC transporter permease ProW [Sulfurospirillum barnesii]AFL67346.1 ABC-type proline/glycine betaine transport system, permease component [Sulfurospirillum barnesii SES-3]